MLQLAGNDPETLAAAVALAATLGVDGVDLNVGCPLPQARDACFGAYLLDREKWPLLERCVAAMRAAAEPAGLVCSCKIRLLETAEATAELARRLEAAGADFLSVHGRPRPAAERHRTHRQEAADLDAIGVVAAAVSIPVVANGNTEYPADVAANMATTGCAGVMAGEGLLRDPLLFSSARERADGPSRGALLAAALEYVDLAERHPPESVRPPQPRALVARPERQGAPRDVCALRPVHAGAAGHGDPGRGGARGVSSDFEGVPRVVIAYSGHNHDSVQCRRARTKFHRHSQHARTGTRAAASAGRADLDAAFSSSATLAASSAASWTQAPSSGGQGGGGGETAAAC